jgi:erythromycin esterase-like protein
MKRILLVALLGCPLAAQDPVHDWIVKSAVRLETPEARRGFADMAGIKKIVGDARIVSLGEATHGTREFFQLKHRMLEYLATEMGFTIFSIEANMPEAYRLNDYVLKGEGDPAQLLKGMYFWTWNTEEVLDMIRWMREFNQSGKGRVEFTGFDMQTPTVALDIAAKFLNARDSTYAESEEYKKAAAAIRAPQKAANAFGVATGSFPVADARGKKAKFSGWIKTENVTRGYAGLWWRVDGPAGEGGRPSMLAFDNMQSRGVKGTTDWTRYEIELPVAENAVNINFGALFPGDGTAWFDGFAVELDGKKYEGYAGDLDFEEWPVQGFYTGGQGYRVQLDSAAVKSGKTSLRMSHSPDPENAVDPKEVSAMWKGVVRHMEDARESYAKSGAAKKDIEWAIQNARVVLQYAQLKSNEVPRDRSMADNVKWILDQNPQAKIVLWAHNGHVTTRAVGAYEPMGATLRSMFGPQMVVFGFAFGQGSFQAIEVGGPLRDFTVPPTAEGSLDAMLSSTKIPLFALDLRTAPKEGPAAKWLGESHPMRMVGAVYSDKAAAGYINGVVASQAYDALLFVDRTTAARKNP